MNTKILMRITACLFAIIVFYVIVVWQPKIGASEDVYSENLMEENNDSMENDNDVESDKGFNSTDDENNIDNNIYGENILIIKFDNISDQLSLDEKKTINKILGKLSVTDCAKVNEILYNNYGESDKGALEFIKKRLLEEDYRKIEGILSQYLDLA